MNDAEKKPPPQTALPAPLKPHWSAAIVDRWFADTFHGQPLSTNEFNRLARSREALKALLAAKE